MVILEVVIKLANLSGGTTQWLLRLWVSYMYGVGGQLQGIFNPP